jgi:oligopeptidase B
LPVIRRHALRTGPYAYFTRYVDGAEHPIVSRISRADFDAGRWSAAAGAAPPASLESLLDANELAAGLEFFKLGGSEHSPDHSMIAYATDTKGCV